MRQTTLFRIFSIFLLALIGFVLSCSGNFFNKENGYSAVLYVGTGSNVDIDYINSPVRSIGQCESILTQVESGILSQCNSCNIVGKQCLHELPLSQEIFFRDFPVEYAVAYLKNGVLVFKSRNKNIADIECEKTVVALNSLLGVDYNKCNRSEALRGFFRPQGLILDSYHIGLSSLAFFVSFFVSLLSIWLLIRYDHLHSNYSHDNLLSGPQKFHTVPTPRIGGIPVFLGLVVSAIFLLIFDNRFSDKDFGFLLICSLPAFLGGVVEDLTKSVSVSKRLALTMFSGLLGIWLIGGKIDHLDVFWLDSVLYWTPIAVIFTMVAVGGVANSLNIVDGYNGLAAGFGLVASIVFAVVAGLYADGLLVFSSLVMAGALLGFLLFNWPKGRIFLGDGGAYLLGFWLAETAILLVVRNPSVSPWFPLAVLIYPIFETVFSVWRRKFLHQSHPGLPDSMHLHQMVYKRLVRIHVGTKIPHYKILRNSCVAPYFWMVTAIFSIVSLFFIESTRSLVVFCLIFSLVYIFAYFRLLKWGVPSVFRIHR